MYPRAFDQVVRDCEEFELDFRPLPETTGRVKAYPALVRDKSPAEKYSGRYIGLCSNCENRGTCIYPKPEGGVWHCDEYR